MSCHVPGPMHGPGAWTWNMAPVYTHAQSPISTISLLRPSTVIRYVAVYANSPRAYAYACTTPSSTYPPTHLRRVISKQHLSESGPWLLPAGSRGWSAGAQIGARLTRLFPACHCQCLVSLRAPVSPPPPRPLSLRAFAFLLFARPRCPLARSRCARSPLCRLLPRRAARWVACLESPPHTDTLWPSRHVYRDGSREIEHGTLRQSHRQAARLGPCLPTYLHRQRHRHRHRHTTTTARTSRPTAPIRPVDGTSQAPHSAANKRARLRSANFPSPGLPALSLTDCLR
jgi:hypothetical protein